MKLAAALAVGCALVLAFPDKGWVAARRLGRTGRTLGVRAIVAAGALTAGSLAFVLPGPLLVLTVAVAVLGMALGRQVRADAARRARLHAVQDTAELTDLLACQLRAGLLPGRALAASAADHPILQPVSSVAAAGGDVPTALRAASVAPGRGVLVDVAGAWQVAERVGAPLADVLERVADATRETAELHREVAANVAPARATARIMAVLPFFGLMLGSGLGADPLAVITSSIIGALCVTAGVALASLGLVWIDRIAMAAEG